MKVNLEYLSVGANRHPAGADWDCSSGYLAFGAGRNIALWQPKDSKLSGVRGLLKGHTRQVTAVKFFRSRALAGVLLISGSSDHSLRIWTTNFDHTEDSTCLSTILKHGSSINCIETLEKASIFASGSVDGTVNIWRIEGNDEAVRCENVQSISLGNHFIPLSVAFHSFKDQKISILAIGGTDNSIHCFLCENDNQPLYEEKARLIGHDGWVRSLDFVSENDNENPDVLLASASQDKYVRLWRISQHNSDNVSSQTLPGLNLDSLGSSLSNKAYRFKSDSHSYSVIFEALLLGHDDWIYTARWTRKSADRKLLSASADGSIVVWQKDAASEIWLSSVRLGEVSVQKGSTTATGSSGGFWSGLWSPTENSIAGLDRSGSWRLWTSEGVDGHWEPEPGISGHTKEVRGIAWTADGDCLLSVSADQSTRLHSRWNRNGVSTWHEMARPQIHGYDLNCVSYLGPSRFVSGADEKLLRVFDEPAVISQMVQRLSGSSANNNPTLPALANMPVLGLSNKAIENDSDAIQADGASDSFTQQTHHNTLKTMVKPPNEGLLAKHTLWPEVEKLYGHGYEIAAVCASHDGKLIASSCKASSVDHAAIRLYRTDNWTEIKPPLKSHTLTITQMQFSDDDELLLSVGRDRQWTIFSRATKLPPSFQLHASQSKAHSRMILGMSWAPVSIGRVFATAGRDKCVKLWSQGEGGYKEVLNLSVPAAATAVSFAKQTSGDKEILTLLSGLEDGGLILYRIHGRTFETISKFQSELR